MMERSLVHFFGRNSSFCSLQAWCVVWWSFSKEITLCIAVAWSMIAEEIRVPEQGSVGTGDVKNGFANSFLLQSAVHVASCCCCLLLWVQCVAKLLEWGLHWPEMGRGMYKCYMGALCRSVKLRTVLEQGEILVQTVDVNPQEKDEKSGFPHFIYKFGDYKMHLFSAAFSLSILAGTRDVIAKLKSIKTYLRPLWGKTIAFYMHAGN